MTFCKRNAVDNDTALFRQDTEYLSLFPLVFAGDHDDPISSLYFHFHTEKSDDLGRKAGNSSPSAIDELAGNRPEDAIPLRTHFLSLFLDENDGVVIE